MDRLWSGPRVVGRLGSRVWISARFQIFALTAAGGMSQVGREIVRRGKCSWRICSRGKCPGGRPTLDRQASGRICHNRARCVLAVLCRAA